MAAILYGILQYFLSQVVIKFVVYVVLYFFITQAINYIIPYLFTGDNGINAALNNMGGSVVVLGQTINTTGEIFYFLNYFLIPQWLQTMLVAYATVFLIRRMPFIG